MPQNVCFQKCPIRSQALRLSSVYGKNFAIGNGDHHEAGKDKEGKPFSRKFRYTGVWVRKQMSTGERKWQCVNEHSSKLE